MPSISSIQEIDLSPVPGKTYVNFEREWREEFIYFLMVDRFHDDQARQPILQTGARTASPRPMTSTAAKSAASRPTSITSPGSAAQRFGSHRFSRTMMAPTTATISEITSMSTHDLEPSRI